MTLTQSSEEGLKISNAGTNGQFLQKQSGNTGGLTWADVTSVGGATGVDFNDDVYIRLGTGNDLKLWHNAGADSYIRNESGNLRIQANGAGDNAIVIVPDAAVQLMYNNDIRLATTSAGVNIGGNLSSDSGTSFTINAGGASGTAAWFLARCGGENAIAAAPNGEVQLYHDNAKKFETASNGIKVENSTATAITVVSADDADGGIYFNDGANQGGVLYQHDGDYMDFRVNGTEKVRIESSGSMLFLDGAKIHFGGANNVGGDLQIWHDGTGNNSYIANGTGNLVISNSNVDAKSISLYGDAGLTEELAHFIQGGAVELFHNDSKKFYTDSGGVTVSGNVTVSDGNGINFGATSQAGGATSELFADYEEGSFTPTLSGGGTSISYSEQYGYYRKIGKTVFVSVRMQFSCTTNSALFSVGGFPFTAAAAGGANYTSGGITYCNVPLDTKDFDPYIGNNVTYMSFYEKVSGNSVVLSSNANNNYIGVGAFYFTDS